jgi:hypothetical protein
MRGSIFQITMFIISTASRVQRAELPLQLKGIPHNHVDLSPLVSIEATGVCIPIGNSELLLAAVYKSPGSACGDAGIIEFLNFRRDLNANHPFWNSPVSSPSGKKLLDLFDVNDFEILAPQFPIHYSPVGSGDVLSIVVHQNVRLSEVMVSDILDSDHLPVFFSVLDHVMTTNHSDRIEKFTDWERFRNLSSDLISPILQITSGVEADKAARDITASIAWAYTLVTSKVRLSDMNSDLPGVDRLLKNKQKLRKLWHETRDSACKTAVN